MADYHHCPNCMKAPWERGIGALSLHRCHLCWAAGCEECEHEQAVFCEYCADKNGKVETCPCCGSSDIDDSYDLILP